MAEDKALLRWTDDKTLAGLRALGFSPAETRAALGLSGRGALRPQALRGNARAALLAEIFSLALQARGSGARQWFLAPESKLGNVLPATLLRDPHNGPNLVKQTLLNMLCGML